MLVARDEASELNQAVAHVVSIAGRFSGKDVSEYLEVFKGEMHLRGIPPPTRQIGFGRVVAPTLQDRVTTLMAESGTWEAFERRLLEEYALDDSTKMTQQELNTWVESTKRDMSTSAVCNEFERRFGRLSTLDQVLLSSAKVLLFLRAVDIQYREALGALLEDVNGPSGLIIDWAEVKRTCSRFDMRRQWRGEPPLPISTPVLPLERIGVGVNNLAPQRPAIERRPDVLTLEELSREMRELRIAQAQLARNENRSRGNARSGDLQRCIWCDGTNHFRRDCEELHEAIRQNRVYMERNMIHSAETQRALRTNFGNGGMKRILEEDEARQAHATTYYSASAGIRAEKRLEEQGSHGIDFWPAILEGIRGVKLSKEDQELAEARIQAITGWADPVESNTSLIEASCCHYEAMVEEKRKRAEESSIPNRFNTRESRRVDEGATVGPERRSAEKGERGRFAPTFKLRSELEQRTNIMKILEERVLDGQVTLPLGELLGIVKKEFHDAIIGMMRRKRQTIEEAGHNNSEQATVSTIYTKGDGGGVEVFDSHYTHPHWARATTEAPVRLGEVKDQVVALIDHGSEINLMSSDFYQKGRWPMTMEHGWKIRAATKATEELQGACPNVKVTIGDVAIDQHFFVQDSASHAVILGEPYITAARMETKVEDNGAAYARIRSQDGKNAVQFITVRPNHERNRVSLKGRADF